MPFPPWELIPPTTPVRDLYRTSVLVCTDDPRTGVLLRCSTGLHDGSATVVHARVDRPDSLKMTGTDDDTQIGAQAQALLGSGRVHAVSIPHIAWKSLGGGLPRRTPIAATIAVLTGIATSLPPISLSVWVAAPVAILLGLLTWLMLRERMPTRIGLAEAPPMTAGAVAERARLAISARPRTNPAASRRPSDSRGWAPPIS